MVVPAARSASRRRATVADEVLLVDDDPAVVEVWAEVLADEGCRVRCADDGLAALAEVQRAVPDLTVGDVPMPGPDGVALAERLGARGNSVPIAPMSAGRPDPRLPGVRFARKPVALPIFVGAIAAARAGRPG